MDQLSFSDYEYGNRKRKTRRDDFLAIMEEIIPWDEWISFVEPYYPKGERGRAPKGIEKMLRMYLLQCWFNLSDEGVEDAIYDSYAMRKFMKINFMDEQVPDATTLCKFRHLLEANGIGAQIFTAIRTALEQKGHMMRGGTIVDASILEAPCSTKNAQNQRDPEMHQARKGNEWHFGMKAHIGVDAGTGYVHTVEATAANASDIVLAHKLIREDDEVVYGDAGYLGIQNRPEIQEDPHKSKIEYRINHRPGKITKMVESVGKEWERHIQKRISSVRSKVEHPFRTVKVQFGYAKVRYRGIGKNLNRLHILFGSANLFMCARAGRTLLGVTG